jgi:hypothetical protein
VAVETSNENEPRVHYFGRIAFDRYLFPPYIPRKALDKKSFPSHDACTYIFGFGVDGESDPLSLLVDVFEEGSSASSSSLAVVDRDLVLLIRKAILRNKQARID